MQFLKKLTAPFIKIFNADLFQIISSFSRIEILIALIVAFIITRKIKNIIFRIISITFLGTVFLLAKYLLVSVEINNIFGKLLNFN